MTTPLGKYKLVKLIAAGGMAEVYLARQAGAAGFEKQVCLKRILPHLAKDKQFVDMFLNEARLASQLDHPNIVSIFDLGEANGNYFIAMEFIDGPNLRGVAKRAAELNEFLPLAEVLKIVAQAAAGLQYAHDLADRDGKPLGLVHRDISPDNILVHRNGTAKVVDFGIAKAAGSTAGATRTGTLKGKVAYMPPEQLRGEPLDRRTDVFALGVVLYELIGGKRPWSADNEVALIGQMMTTDAVPLGELRPDAPEELVAIVHKALAKDRAARYQSCNELLVDLEALIVQMGQSITQSRLADFVRAYTPPKSEDPNEGTNELSAVQEQTFGTGMAPPIDGGQAGGGLEDFTEAPTSAQNSLDGGTMVMAAPIEPPKSRALLFGAIAFLVVAALIGGGVYLNTERNKPEEAEPVAVDRVPGSVPVAVKRPEPVKAPDPVPVPVPVPEPVAQDPKHPRKVAVAPGAPTPRPASSIPPPVVVITQQQAAPAPVIAAKGALLVQTRPWAKLEIDGREAGVTPLDEPIKLSAGMHSVKMSNPDLGKEITRQVEITAGETKVIREILEE